MFWGKLVLAAHLALCEHIIEDRRCCCIFTRECRYHHPPPPEGFHHEYPNGG